MNFLNISQSFTEKEKLDSFFYLQNFILDKDNTNEKFFIGRLSGNEPNLCGRVLSKENISNHLIQEMLGTAGIQFLNSDDLMSYVKLYSESCKNASLLAVWSGGMYKQAENFYNLLNKIIPDQKRICAQALEPFYFMQEDEYKMNEYFMNKKVLIISSHKQTIESQLPIHSEIFDRSIFHETTEFYIYKPPQQNGGNHDNNSWIYHYEIIKKEISKISEKFDFDIALVSCGGFGMIASNFIYKELNKNVMYIGGGLQLYFGIKGNRWTNHPVIPKMFNDKWCSVKEEDRPESLSKNPRLCENSCYW